MAMMDKSLTELYCSKTLGHRTAPEPRPLFPDNGRIDIPYSPDLNPESFTVALWAKSTSTGGYASPITSRNDVNGGQSTHGYIIYNDNGGNWNFWTGDGDPGWDTLYGGPVKV